MQLHGRAQGICQQQGRSWVGGGKDRRREWGPKDSPGGEACLRHLKPGPKDTLSILKTPATGVDADRD